MFAKFARSWALVKASAGVLKQDKELLVFPAISAVASLLVMASFILPLFGLLDFKAMDQGEREPMWLYAWVFLFYLTQYFVIFYSNTALVGAAMIRLRGGDPTVADGLNIAWSKRGTNSAEGKPSSAAFFLTAGVPLHPKLANNKITRA